jgi:hypothetical protein
MLLIHAKALAVAEVIRDGITFPKNGPFTEEQQRADDWEPIQVDESIRPVPADCGCEPVENEK